MKSEKVPTGHIFISFDLKPLFMSVPFVYAINIILRRIYDYNELCTNISKKEMKELLLLYTKNVHFTFDNEVINHKTQHVYKSRKLGSAFDIKDQT